jgi:hypothetical protein
MLLRKIIAVYYQNYIKPVKVLCRQSTELWTAKAGPEKVRDWGAEIKNESSSTM